MDPTDGDLLDFTDRVVLVTGGATGIGAATVGLLVDRGADVHVVDVAPVEASGVEWYHCDVGDRESVDRLVDELPTVIDVVMNCAGVPNGGRFGPEEIMRINFLGLRHLTEAVVGRIRRGGSVVHIASTAGRGWAARAAELQELMLSPSFDEGLEWLRRHGEICGDGYVLSKEAVQYYTMWRALQLGPHGVRMNSVCPGVTNTRLLDDFRRGVGNDVIERATTIAGRLAEPSDVAPVLLFLADPVAARFVTGVNLNVDGGTGAAHLTGVW